MELLFSTGKSVSSYPVKIVYLKTPVELQFPAQAMFVVAKKNFKRSPDRNKLKRRMREVYRLNKIEFYQTLSAQNIKLVLAVIYTSKKEEDYSVIESSLKKALSNITKNKEV